MIYYVYMLRCADDSIYTGMTKDIEWRLIQHNAGFGGDYTSRRRPLQLIWCADFPSEKEAFFLERKLKKWTRAKKIALSKGDFDTLHDLAKSTARKKANAGDCVNADPQTRSHPSTRSAR